MEKRVLKIESLKNVTEDSFKPYGQIFGLEKGLPTEDNIFIRCWSNNINIEAEGEKIDFCHCALKRVSKEDMKKASSENRVPGWLKNFEGGTRVSILERHPLTTETFFFLEGDSIFVMAPPDPSKPKPDLSRVKAFLLDSSLSISLWKGTWHWPPIPVYESARICIVRTGALNDFDRVDLDVEYDLVI